MSAFPKLKCRAPMVWGFVPKGCLDRLPLATAERGTFFAPCISRTAGKGAIMASPRTEVATSLHRLANNIECELVDIFRELLAESRIGDVSAIAWHGNDFINALRDVRDGKGGDA